jgi:hypothetical protein
VSERATPLRVGGVAHRIRLRQLVEFTLVLFDQRLFVLVLVVIGLGLGLGRGCLLSLHLRTRTRPRPSAHVAQASMSNLLLALLLGRRRGRILLDLLLVVVRDIEEVALRARALGAGRSRGREGAYLEEIVHVHVLQLTKPIYTPNKAQAVTRVRLWLRLRLRRERSAPFSSSPAAGISDFAFSSAFSRLACTEQTCP